MKSLMAPVVLALNFVLSQPALALTPAQDRAACISEIAGLFIEKSQLTAPAQASMRALIEKNLQAKIAEFESYFGRRLDPEEIKKHILEKENGGKAAATRAKAKETQTRAAEKTMKMDWGFEPRFTAT